jgi:hypothetical protein
MPKYVFSINSGRSGSNYLARIFSAAVNTIAVHEANPSMAGEDWMNCVQFDGYEASYKKRKVKVDAILSGLPANANYVESNHMFIKTFFDVCVDAFGDQLAVVFLRRRLAESLKSFCELEYFGRNAESAKWMCRSDAVTRAIEPIAPFEEMDLYERIISYLVDIEARGQRFKSTYPKIQVLEYRVEELNDRATVIDMFDRLGFAGTAGLDSLIGKPINRRTSRKRIFDSPIPLSVCEEKVEEYLSKATGLGITLPSTLYI